jgi:hypothetical protein
MMTIMMDFYHREDLMRQLWNLLYIIFLKFSGMEKQ